jgi:hypothetical protein
VFNSASIIKAMELTEARMVRILKRRLFLLLKRPANRTTTKPQVRMSSGMINARLSVTPANCSFKLCTCSAVKG